MFWGIKIMKKWHLRVPHTKDNNKYSLCTDFTRKKYLQNKIKQNNSINIFYSSNFTALNYIIIYGLCFLICWT